MTTHPSAPPSPDPDCPSCQALLAALAASEERVATLEATLSAMRRGRTPGARHTEHGRLVALACEALGAPGKPLSQKTLAERLGVTAAILSRANNPAGEPLAERHVATLRQWIEEAGARRPATVAKKRSRKP